MATKRTAQARRPAAESEIYEAVLAALLDGRLPAGTPLREHRLAAMFGRPVDVRRPQLPPGGFGMLRPPCAAPHC